jgi:4-hydroxy-3-methylbut-2-enyl diphosphate reductase
MHVIRAEAMGMCFGVRDALSVARSVVEPHSITIHGELVHNERVLRELRARGFLMDDERDRAAMPSASRVMITAHGISNRRRRQFEQGGKELVDTTCPLVTRVHQAALRLQEQGFHVLVIGRSGHVEVQGIVEDLDDYDVVGHVDQVRRYAHDRIGIVCQTTSSLRDVEEIHEAVRRLNPHATIRFVDTVCQPTKDRQRALEQLLDNVDVVVVVGGANSNNTKQLVAVCREHGIAAYHVQSAADLDADWFADCSVVGLTAGASTLDDAIDEVHRALSALPAAAYAVSGESR